jgi:GTP-binding protein EngB required for normal cell division
MDPSELRMAIERFRILIIGRANAGKTTILQRVCKTRENPEIYNSAGKKIDPAVLMASRERGMHDIENEIVFRNNPGFVFHDSRGFEAGGQFEFDKAKAFIAKRSKERSLSDRIHIIWYCIPMDEDSRSFTEAEVKFFSQCDTGSIPVIVLFTKFDALYDDEFAELISKGVSRKDAEALAPQHAKEAFANGPQLKLLYNHKGNQRPPKCHICLPDMDKDGADCGPLIERTAEILNDDTLKQLFVSTQRTTLELCMRYAVERSLVLHLDSTQAILSREFGKSNSQIIDDLGRWFPRSTITRVSVSTLCRAQALLTDHDPDPLTGRKIS